jgi:MFS family permease
MLTNFQLSVTFVTLQPFSTILGRRFGPKYWIPFLMVCWGSICMAHAGIKNRGTLIALRLLLGAAEAGFVPTTFVSFDRNEGFDDGPTNVI